MKRERASAMHRWFPNQSNPTKASKKHHPLKVVYISNPMKITTSASAFRAVVQELTGKNSDIADILSRQTTFDSSTPLDPAGPYDALIPHRPPSKLGCSSAVNSFISTPDKLGGMEEYFPGLHSPSLLFEPAQFGGGNYDGE